MNIEFNKHLYNLLKTGLIKKEMFIGKDIDEMLDLRDDEKFEKKWMKVYHDIESLKGKIRNDKIINNIRKQAFVETNRLSGSSDLAGYISDDFELISRAIELEYNDRWLNGMFKCYLVGVFPCENIDCVEEDIKNLINKYLRNGH